MPNSESIDDGGPAFPIPSDGRTHGTEPGMSLHDYYRGQALANSTLCTGTAPEWQLAAWFGSGAGITREQIVARQATEYAKALLATRKQ